MNNLRKFATEADYSAATLNYPAVSWVVSGDTLHYDLSGDTPTPSAPAIKIAFTMDECGNGKEMHVEGNGDMINNNIVSAITVNGDEIAIAGSMTAIEMEADTDYLIEYSLSGDVTDIGYAFYLTTPWGCASEAIYYDILFPEQVTNIGTIHSDQVYNIIILAETPPTISWDNSSAGQHYIYVPDEAVNTYKSSWASVLLDDKVKPLSEYEGNIPLS